VTRIHLAFSPDSDDIFMFWPLLRGKIDTEGLTFTHERADTETLNQRALQGDVDVIAISIGHYARLTEKYLLLPHGASIGRGYGPVVVAKESAPLESLRGKTIGIPGMRTTAFLTLSLLLDSFTPKVIPISPYSAVFNALAKGEIDAALLIHEGRLTFEREGYKKVIDIGAGWAAQTGGLPLPLGGNAIRKDLGPDRIAQVSRLCRESIAWALAHRDEVIDALLREESRAEVGLDRAMLDKYLAMYANDDTREMKEDVKKAIVEMFRRARERGLIEANAVPEFAP